jgi:hypothetical protein
VQRLEGPITRLALALLLASSVSVLAQNYSAHCQLLDLLRQLERCRPLASGDRLSQACQETTVTRYNGKGEPVRTVHKRRLIMPATVEAADGIRKMDWTRWVKAD